MSTKTTFKRIALVAVASLGFGVLTSLAPANAAATSFTISNKSLAGSATLVSGDLAWATTGSVTTLTITSGDLVVADIGKTLWTDQGQVCILGAIASDSATSATCAAATALSNGNAANDKFYKGAAASVTVASGIVANSITGMTVAAGGAGALALNLTGNPAGTAAKGRITIGGTTISGATLASTSSDTNMIVPFTAPVTAGTYTASVQYTDGGTYSGVGTDTITQPFTLTVTAAADLSLALSTAMMTSPGGSGATAATNAVARSAPKAAGTPISNIEVLLKKSTGVDDTQGHTITASVSGMGFVAVSTGATHAANAATARVATNATGDASRYVLVASDGTAGTGTITVSVTNVNTAVTSVLGTFTVTSYGSATTLAVTANYTIGRAGGFTTGWATNGTRAAESTSPLAAAANTSAPAFTVKVTDANGALVNLTNTLGAATVPTVVSSDTTVVSGGTCVLDDGASVYNTGAGVGYYNCSFTTTPTSVSGGKSTLTIRTPNPADTTTYLTATLDVTVGGTASTGTETLTLDKDSYAPGEGMTVTQTAKDSAGNPVADGVASYSVSFNKQTGGTAVTASWYANGAISSDDSLGRKTIFAPVVSGPFVASATSAGSVALSATATVGDDASTAAANAASDAASEAIDAANAATDAANLAAEAADAATVAAEEARDAADAATAAVEALATEVATLMAALKAQITTLANTVAKIAKKVKA